VPLLANCRGFIFPGEEDFGIAPLEAMACGRPVIAYAGGGALETVVSGVTGTFFRTHDIESLCEALNTFDPALYNADEIRAHALRWDTHQFQNRLIVLVEQAREGSERRLQPVDLLADSTSSSRLTLPEFAHFAPAPSVHDVPSVVVAQPEIVADGVTVGEQS
jgi:hypothetical protein